MKTKKENRKLEFKKETIARLGEGFLNGVYGGTGGAEGGHHTVTKNMMTCTCQTNATVKEPCLE